MLTRYICYYIKKIKTKTIWLKFIPINCLFHYFLSTFVCMLYLVIVFCDYNIECERETWGSLRQNRWVDISKIIEKKVIAVNNHYKKFT